MPGPPLGRPPVLDTDFFLIVADFEAPGPDICVAEVFGAEMYVWDGDE